MNRLALTYVNLQQNFCLLYGFYIIFCIKFFFKNKYFIFIPRDSFPFDQQFNILMRFIVDQTQTPNLKVGNDLS